MSNTCKLLIITDTYVGVPGGSERHLYNFLSGLSSKFEATALQLIPTGNPMLKDGEFRGKTNVTLSSHPMAQILSLNYFVLLYKLVRFIRTNKIDLVISYHEKSDITNFIIKKCFGKGIISISSKRDLGFKLTGLLRKIIKYITPKFDAITAPSNSIKHWLVVDFKLDKEKIFVIKNGVDLASYPSVTDKEIQLLKNRLDMASYSKIMTSVGCLKPIKGHQYLLKAFSTFKAQSVEDWCLVLIGDGELRPELQCQAHRLGIQDHVLFLGYQKNVPEWLLVSDLMVSATLSEGLSNALIEGCAAGCPIIATNVGGNPEIITNGYNGLLVEPENSEEISEALLMLDGSNGLFSSMASNSRIKAITEFTNFSMVDSLEALYSDYTKKL